MNAACSVVASHFFPSPLSSRLSFLSLVMSSVVETSLRLLALQATKGRAAAAPKGAFMRSLHALRLVEMTREGGDGRDDKGEEKVRSYHTAGCIHGERGNGLVSVWRLTGLPLHHPGQHGSSLPNKILIALAGIAGAATLVAAIAAIRR